MGRAITKSELMQIDAPDPTETWNPIPHGEVMNQVDKVFQDMGVSVLNTQISIDDPGYNCFVTHRLDVGMTQSRHLEIGWRNSTNKRFSLGFTSGSRVMVCSNLVFSGSWYEYKRHVPSLEEQTVREMASKGLSRAITDAKAFASWHEHLKEIPCDQKEKDHIFMTMIKNKVIPGKKVMQLLNAYDEESMRYGSSLYTVYNCATQVFRGASLFSISERSSTLNDIMQQKVFEMKDEQPGSELTVYNHDLASPLAISNN